MIFIYHIKNYIKHEYLWIVTPLKIRILHDDDDTGYDTDVNNDTVYGW